MDIKELEQIFELVKQNDITDFELNREGLQLKLSRSKPELRMVSSGVGHGIEPAILSSGSYLPSGTQAVSHDHEAKAIETTDNYKKVESPLVGTFYRKPGPESEPFVSEGSRVKKGDTLCIVEAMKLMNEIEAPVSGTVVKILASDGDVIEFAEVLFLIDPS